MVNHGTISKAELSRLLGVSKARVSQLVGDGLPVRPDGRLDRTEALAWVAQFASSSGAGWHHRRQGTESVGIAERASQLLDGGPVRVPAACKGAHRARLPDAEMRRRIYAGLSPELRGARDVLDTVLGARCAVLPELLVALGVRDMTIICAAIEFFQALVMECSGVYRDDAYDWGSWCDDIPHVQEPDYAAIAKRLRVPYDAAAMEKTLDDLVTRLFEILERSEPAVRP